jgi:GNAT superfamily N-acetyltransferase
MHKCADSEHLFTIRVASSTDAPAISAVLTSSYTTLLPGLYNYQMLQTAMPLMTVANPALLACGTYFVAEASDGRILGCGGWTAEHPETGEIIAGLAHIRHFATDPQMTRMGVGKALLTLCVTQSFTKNIRTLECCSTLPAQSFYAAAGFQNLGGIEAVLGPGIRLPAIRMQKTLLFVSSIT